jgi:nitrate reductase NapE component
MALDGNLLPLGLGVVGRHIKERSERERFLSLFGPISMVGLFSIWAVGLVAGFGLVFWSLERHLPDHYDLGSYVYMSGTTLVTLGYGDFTPIQALRKRLRWGRLRPASACWRL